jgi:hypothetical protein
LNEGVDAAIFYVSAGLFVGGTIRAVRASVERRARDRLGLMLAAGGLIGLATAIAVFITGPKNVLPF